MKPLDLLLRSSVIPVPGLCPDKSPSRIARKNLGLAIAKGIVEAHGGRIWIENANDFTGTRMVVLIPTGD